MTFGTLYLGRMIADFARQYTDLEVAVEFEDRMVDLVRGGYDVGIRIGILKDSSLIARKLCTDARVICCSPDFASANGLPKTIDELSSFACIDYSNVNTSQLWQFENPAFATEPISVAMHGRIVANNGEAMRDMAIAGLGLVLLPMFIAADALRAGTLVSVLVRGQAAALQDLRRLSSYAACFGEGARLRRSSRHATSATRPSGI